jgi:nucleoside-triphosphatase THEP1
MPERKIVLITGDRQIGKTTLCLRLAEALRQTGVQATGLITRRTGTHDLTVEELASGQIYALTQPIESHEGIALGHFRMDPQALERSIKALDASFPTQVFILDEIGPLELERGQGWVRAITLLKDARYDIAVIVVRPELLTRAIWQLPASFYTVLSVKKENRDDLPASLLHVVREASCPSGR